MVVASKSYETLLRRKTEGQPFSLACYRDRRGGGDSGLHLQLAQYLGTLDADRLADLDEFDDLDAPLSGLVFGDIRLRLSKPIGQLGLSEPGLLPRLNQGSTQPPIAV